MKGKSGVLIVVVIALIAIGVYYVDSEFGLFSVFFQGFTVTSIGLSNMISPGDPESSTEWLVGMTINGYGQSLAGTLDESTLTTNGYSSRYPVSITATMPNQNAFFIIDNNFPDSIKEFDIETKVGTMGCLAGWCTINVAPASCSTGTTYIINDYLSQGWLGLGGPAIVSRTCITENIVGNKANINSIPTIDSEVDFQFNNGQSTETLSLSWEVPSAQSSDGIVKAQWVNLPLDGSTIGLISVGSNFYAINRKGFNAWYPVEKGLYEGSNGYIQKRTVAVSKFETLKTVGLQMGDFSECEPNFANDVGAQSCLISCTVTPTSTMTCIETDLKNEYINPVNIISSQLLSANDVMIPGLPTATPTTHGGSDALLINLGTLMPAKPVVNLRFRGDWLGVVIPEGEPRITGTNSPITFNSGNKGTVTIYVTNDGTEQSVMQAGLTGTCGVKQVAPSSLGYINPGANGELTLMLETTGSATWQGSCTIQVTDVNSGLYDTTTISINMLPPVECTKEGETFYEGGNNILICENGEKNVCKSCQYGVEFIEGQKTSNCNGRTIPCSACSGVFDCADIPTDCTVEGFAPTANKPCCVNLIVKDGVCVEETGNQTCIKEDEICSIAFVPTGTCCDDLVCGNPIYGTCGQEPFKIPNIVWVILATALLAIAGYTRSGGKGAILGGIIGLIVGLIIYIILETWWLQLIGLVAGIAGGIIIIYLLILSLPLIAAILISKVGS